MDILLALIPILVVGGAFMLWLMMLLHALQHPIPDKVVWIILLILTNIVGGVVYYVIVYQKSGKKMTKRTAIVTASVLALIIIGIALLALPTRQSTSDLQAVPLSELTRQINQGEIKHITVKGDELFITKRGDSTPSLRSEKRSDASLHEQGIDTSKVQITFEAPSRKWSEVLP